MGYRIWDMRRRRDTTFGGRVRLLREDAELTQDQVTDALAALGVTIGRSYISEIERSKKMPNGEVIAGLARVLRTTADYLLCLSESPDAPGDAAPVAGMSAEASAPGLAARDAPAVATLPTCRRMATRGSLARAVRVR